MSKALPPFIIANEAAATAGKVCLGLVARTISARSFRPADRLASMGRSLAPAGFISLPRLKTARRGRSPKVC